MIKKSIFIAILLSSTLACTVFCQEYIVTALPISVPQQDGRGLEASMASSAAQSSMTLDRSGIDKASVHLQILQQSTLHFSDSAQAKKPAIDDKKIQIKPQSNS